jgi:uncharacterized integral membrane protein (TIGR00697 family)
MKTSGVSFLFLVFTTLFIASLVSANVIAIKIISLFGFFFPAGIIVFPITYILGDILTEVYGFKKAKMVIWLAFLANLVFVIFAVLAIQIPSAPFWKNQQSFQQVLGFTPRLLLASFFAFIIGSFANAFVMSKMKVLTKARFLWSRVIGSTIVGEGLDSFIFITLAFYGAIPLGALFGLFYAQWFFKVTYETVLTPLTYQVINYLKNKEKIDTFDHNVNYNPFIIE